MTTYQEEMRSDCKEAPWLTGREIRSVAVVRASRIGDLLCATPALRALRAALPDAHITLIGLPLVRDLAERNPHIDRFLPFPGFPGMADQFFEPRCALEFLRRMQDERLDLSVQLHGSGVNSNVFALLLGARDTVGSIRPGDTPGLLDASLPLPKSGHEIDRVLSLLLHLGAPHRGYDMEFPLWAEDEDEAEVLLRGAARPLIGIHPGSWDKEKRWPVDRFCLAAEELRRRAGGTLVVLGGTLQQGGIVMDTTKEWLNLIGSTTLPVAGAIIKRLAVLITNDSGLAHIAYALGTPSVTIFGPTDPSRWGPPPGPHLVERGNSVCEISVTSVLEAAIRVGRWKI